MSVLTGDVILQEKIQVDCSLYLFPTSAESYSEVQSQIVACGHRNNAFALETHKVLRVMCQV